ncbi:MAG: ROK family protein [Actinobacteria bacterium]|nr:ROK family protein [Actinomycetota bacterium]
MAVIGVDLGGTKIFAVLRKGDDVAREAKRKTPTQGGPLQVVDAIVAVIDELGGVDGVDAVGVGAPGAVDVAAGLVKQAPNLPGWHEPFGLAAALSDALDGLPVAIDNDVNVGALAEHRLGAGKGAADMLGVFVGTGVGGGLILDGQLRHGPLGFAGEIGHTIVKRGGRRCGCGGLGHLEAYAGRAALEKRARLVESEGRDTALVELAPSKRMTSGVFAKALVAGDAVTIELLDEAVGALGVAIASAVTLLDLELVVVGGGLADRLGPAFIGRIEQAVRSDLFAEASTLRVVPGELGDQGGALGAALIAEAIS